MKTVQFRLQKALEAEGYVVDLAHPTRKYVVMKPGETTVLTVTQPVTHRFFLGRSGALRYASNGNVTSSIPYNKTKARLLAKEPN